MKLCGEKTDEQPCSGAGNQQNRQVVHQSRGVKKEYGDHDLRDVVRHASGYADAKKAEIGAAKQGHDGQAARSACQTVEDAEKIPEKKTDHQDTHCRHEGGFPPGIAHQDKQYAEIGKSDFDARDSGEKWNQGFQVSENDGQGGKKSEIRDFSGHGLCDGIHLGRGGCRFSFYDDFVGEADDRASFFCDGGLLYAEMIRAVGLGHNRLAVFDGAHVGVIYRDGLILHKGIGAVILSIHGDADGGTGIFREKVKAEP